MSLVGVASFGINATILDNVFESIIHQTSTATLVTLWAYGFH